MQSIRSIGNEEASDTAVVGVMSGNYVQRGDLAAFNKHARAKMAVNCGVDLVLELPTPYVLQSAEGFAKAGVYILEKLGVCDYISFGSESGDLEILSFASEVIVTDKANTIIREWLDKGLSYAAAGQKAADALMGKNAEVFKSPNNVLGIEYIKALNELNSKIKPITIKRTGGDHDSETGYSASALRKVLLTDNIPIDLMPEAAAAVCMEEINKGRKPISIKSIEQAILSRLRLQSDYSKIAGVSEGLEKRFERYAAKESSIDAVLEKTKTKRYPMSRLRRVLICAALGIKKEDTQEPPPYIRILAMNEKGKKLLAKARKKANLPIITKPASVCKMDGRAIKQFKLESSATDLYTLAYENENNRIGGQEWLISPVILE